MKAFRTLISFTAALAFTFAVGYLTSILVEANGEWYVSLSKPLFVPSEKFFGIAWIVIYVLSTLVLTITIARRELWRAGLLWISVGILNVAWCAVFFRFHMTLFGLSIILTEVVAVSFLITYYIKNTRELWLACIPILAWYIYAFIMNFGIFLIN